MLVLLLRDHTALHLNLEGLKLGMALCFMVLCSLVLLSTLGLE